MGCGMFLSLAQATVLASGPALKQEERKSPFKAEGPEWLKPWPSTMLSLRVYGTGPGHTLLLPGITHQGLWPGSCGSSRSRDGVKQAVPAKPRWRYHEVKTGIQARQT